MPNNSEELVVAETKLMGLLIQHPRVFVETDDRLKADDFSSPVFRVAYEELREMYVDGGDVEFIDLVKRVSGKNGKSAYVDLQRAREEGVSPASTNWALGVVLRESRRRYLHNSLLALVGETERAEDPTKIFSRVLEIAVADNPVKGEVYDGPAMGKRVYARQEARLEGGDTIQGYRTGFESVDSHLGGLVPGRMTIISGPSGHGKTGLVCNWMAHISVVQEVPGLFASLEMSAADVEDRLVALLSGMNLSQIQSGAANSKIQEAIDDIRKGALIVTDNHPRDVSDVVFLIQRYTKTHGIKILALDYVGELVRDSGGPRDEGRDERFARWVKLLRDQAKMLQIHIIILAQVNYEGALAESKKMGHIADHHLHFYREGGAHLLECRKNRFGPSGHRYVVEYDRQTQKMRQTEIQMKGE